MQQLYEMSTNFFFSINEISSDLPQVSEAEPGVFLLGVSFRLDAHHSKPFVNQQINRFLSNVAWFHYRKHFYPILAVGSAKELTSDSGWGCMIRAGQMLLFVAVLRHLHPEKWTPKTPLDNNCLKVLRDYFFEGMSAKGLAKLAKSAKPGSPLPSPSTILGPFALQHFVHQARVDFQLAEGSWFRPTTFLLGLKKLMKPLKELQNLRVFNSFEHIIYFESLCKKAFVNFEKGSVTCWQDAAKMLSEREWDRQVLFSVCTMLGLELMDARYKPFLKGLLEVESFVGMIGGHNQRAYYFVGFKGDMDFYYLDPHYVTSAVPTLQDDAEARNQFFVKTFMTIPFAKLSSSVSISYLLRGRHDFAKLWAALQRLEKEYQEDYFLAYFLNKEETEADVGDIVVLD